MGWNPFDKKSENDDTLNRGQKTALNDGTPVTVIYPSLDNGVYVFNEETEIPEVVKRSDIAEPEVTEEAKKSGWFW